ncbi:nucleotidyl transferase AbiEii/AbiGii toxin family protein [Porphyromonas gingivalis]|uniref:nucleotidyl transferase AbiEii/AbiGii toxin family protein n=1 Tax=Porphyromonas gingivalis TaxID=837 RepID=UPI00037FE0C3|nr:nucleotidyl transferase AbiEii/AbiGii toxin family protein [Porphyromonas gingivalis]EOA10395.1 nucleotidyl transferase, PF08843 family [Porphyromonas gingivalis JCVI SC001]
MNWLSNSIENRRAMLQQAAEAENLPEYAIEKDWWVTMVIKALFQSECAGYLLFKGGTSLSKGWQLIQRFSEDIDLAINYQYFKESIENNNQLKTLRKQCRKYIIDTLVEDIDSRMKSIGLFDYRIYPVTEQDGIAISTDSDPTEIMIEYSPIVEEQSGYLRPTVKVEISCLSMKEPFEEKVITTMIGKHFPDADRDSTAVIPTVLPSRTFLEKAFLLCEEFQKEKPRSLRMSRHLYDLEKLMDTEFGRQALADSALYRAIVEHRRKFYHVSYANYDKDYPDKIEFYPPVECIKDWENDYAALQESFIYGNNISFGQLLLRIEELQLRFRSIGTMSR